MYLKNTWYVAAWANEITRELSPRTLLGEPVLMFRKEDGNAVAMVDRCPHRFAPLHLGKLIGDVVQCGYHGLRFDCVGSCVLNPHGDGRIPQAAKVRTFPVIERYRLLWIWMGEASQADASRIPDFSFLEDTRRATVSGYLRVEGHYELETDNLMDLSHTQFVHSNFQAADSILQGQSEVVQEGDTLYSKLWCPNGKASPQFAMRLGDPEMMVDQWMDMRWDAPSVLRLDTGVTPTGQPRDSGARSLSAHIVTPETETSTHYFFANSRDFRVDDPAMDEAIRNWQAVGFGEQDKTMIEAVQKSMGNTDLLAQKPILLKNDSGAMRVRRTLAQLIAAEQEQERQQSDEKVSAAA